MNLSFPPQPGQSCCTLVVNQAVMFFLSIGLIVLQPAHAIMMLAVSGRALACFGRLERDIWLRKGRQGARSHE